MEAALLSLCVLLASGVSQTASAWRHQGARRIARVHLAGICRVSFATRNPAWWLTSMPTWRDLAGQLNVSLSFVDSNFAQLKDDLLHNRCDVSMFAVAIASAPSGDRRFAQPHLFGDVYTVTSRTNDNVQHWQDIDRPGRLVAVAAGTYHEPLMRRRLQQAKLLVVSPPATREGQVESGRADVHVRLSVHLPDDQGPRLGAHHRAAQAVYLVNYAYAVAPGQARWLTTFNQFVQIQQRTGRLRLGPAFMICSLLSGMVGESVGFSWTAPASALVDTGLWRSGGCCICW